MHLKKWLMMLGLVALVAADGLAQTESGDEEAAQPSPKIEPATEDPDWFNKMLARTVDPLPKLAVASEDGYFSASIPAKLLKPIEATETLYLLTLDFGPGAENPGECYVYRQDLDLAASLVLLSDAIFGVIAQAYGEIEMKVIYGVDAGGLGAVPYMGLDWLYRCKNEATGPVAGQAKHLIASKEGRAIYCQSSTVGYDDAFFNLFKALATSIEFGGESVAEPYFEELALVSIGEQVLGVVHGAHRIDPDGDVEIREAMSILVPVDQQNLQSSDSVSLEYSTVGGELISEVEVEADGGELVTQLSLNPGEEGEWQVEGTFQGKELSANLGAVKLHSGLEERLAMRKLVAAGEKDASTSLPSWVPDMDPSQVASTEFTYLGSDDTGHQVKMVAGPLSFTGIADEQMSLVSATIPLGATAMKIERVHHRGDPFYPLSLAESERAESERAEPQAPDQAPETPAETATESEAAEAATEPAGGSGR